MNIKELLQNKTVLYSVIGGVVILIFLIILMFAITSGSKTAQIPGKPLEKIQKESFNIITTDNPGKALEIQTLLARSNIETKSTSSGSKTTVFLEGGKYTNVQRDRALIEIVKSRLVDQNIG